MKGDFPLVKSLVNANLLPVTSKFAFTLAEVLITLGIIGIVAAMTIPTLIHRYTEKQTVTKLKATYSILSNAIKTAENEEGEFSTFNINGEDGSVEVLAQHLLPYLKVALDCGTIDENGDCAPRTVYKELNGRNRWDYYNRPTVYKLVLLNGVHLYLYGEDQATIFHGENNVFAVYVDINGVKGPNQWGRDFFDFMYFDGGIGLVPVGHPDEKTCSYKNTCMNKTQSGLGCTYYVLKFENMDYLK